MNWLPAISTTTILGIVIFLSRNLIITRLKNSVKHEYDKKLEQLKADLKKRDSEIEALRNGILSNATTRQTIIYNKQIDAIEKIWSSVIDLSVAKGVAYTMISIPFEEIAEKAENDLKVREFLSTINNTNIKVMTTPQALKARPFVSPLTWAYFSAYKTILINFIFKIEMAKNGIYKKEMQDYKHIISLIEKVLPNKVEFLKENSFNSLYYILEEIENSILKSFDMTLNGEKLDKDLLEIASNIIRESDTIMNNMKHE